MVLDIFTDFTVAIPTRDQKALTVAKALLREWFMVYGVPPRLHSELDPFEAEVIIELCTIYDIKRSQPTPSNPQRNGQCEKFNHCLHKLLRTLPAEKKWRWPKHLKEVCYASNATPHLTTGYSPFFDVWKGPVAANQPVDGTRRGSRLSARQLGHKTSKRAERCTQKSCR